MEVKKKFLLGSLAALLVFSFLALGFVEYIFKTLPTITTLVDYKPNLTTRVYSSDGELIGEFFLERRLPSALLSMPEYVKKAFVAAEDANFYRHPGINLKAILRALLRNILAGEVVQGGSTITQQVTRSIILSRERTFTRKIREMILAYRLEKYLSKDEILGLYLNHIYLGNHSYGVEEASETYFHKSVSDLTLAEAAFLAGLPKAPSRYNPFRNPELAKSRQKYVLQRMLEEGYITSTEYEKAYRQPLSFFKYSSPNRKAPYFVDAVQQFLAERIGEEVLEGGGFKIYTTLNYGYQKAALGAIRRGLRELDKRQGYRGANKKIELKSLPDFLKEIESEFVIPPEHITVSVTEDDKIIVTPEEKREPLLGEVYTAVVTRVDSKNDVVEVVTGGGKGTIRLQDMDWAKKPNPELDGMWQKIKDPADALSAGDVISVRLIEITKQGFRFALEQEPAAEAGLLAMDTQDCKVRAMVGGYDYNVSQFNRALNAERQPGSAIKPILYAAALDKGWTASSFLLDAPITFEESDSWKPHNYEETFTGPISFRDALVASKNNPTVRLLWDIGIDYFIDYLTRLGISGGVERNLSIALGSLSMTLKELLISYNVFASGGYRCSRIITVEKVEDWRGRLLYDYSVDNEASPPEQVISPQSAYLITFLLKAVVEEGTGWRARALERPSAGKTGTTDEFRDAWYIGYTPQLIAGVWVGMDDYNKSLGRNEAGARAASPIWVEFMQNAMRGLPVSDFPVPQGIVFAKIDPKTGLLATDQTKNPLFQAYLEGTEPQEYSTDNSGDRKDILKFDEGM